LSLVLEMTVTEGALRECRPLCGKILLS